MGNALAGIRVLEVTVYLAGPFCGTMFATLGADVIKIESPHGGDPMRLAGPYTGPNGITAEISSPDDLALTFLKRTAGKKSVTLNLKTEEGRALFLRLAQTADVILENLQPGSMQRFGLDYEAVRAVKPDIVYCSISGFGQSGQYRNMLAFDPIVQAMAGLMSLNGFEDSPPVRAGFYAADTAAPLFAAFAIMAALRHRDRTGEGQFVDVSMLDCLETILWQEPLDFYLAADLPLRPGNRTSRAAPMECYPTTDGHVMIVAIAQGQWEKLAKVIGAEHLLADPRFADKLLRATNPTEVDAAIAAWTIRHTSDEVMAILQDNEVPVGRVRSIPEVIADRHLMERGVLSQVRHPLMDRPAEGLVAAFPVKFSGLPTQIEQPAPTLGMDNDAVYGELGLSEAELAGLKRAGAI